MKSLVIFASGTGTNALNIISHFKSDPNIKVAAVFTNNPKAPVIASVHKEKIPSIIFSRKFFSSPEMEKLLDYFKPDLIVLAGFLWLMPPNLVGKYNRRMINIHPALLPSHGGPGMYGQKVHESVHRARELQSGITIHYLDDKYDQGEVIAQYICELEEQDSPDTIANKVRHLEHKHYPEVIKSIIEQI